MSGKLPVPTPSGSALADRLAALRRAADLTQSALGDVVGLSVGQVERTERGRRLADGGVIERWSAACGGTPEDAREAMALIPEMVVLYEPE
jgi:transcriptional regulator with XRE-family HTH domain